MVECESNHYHRDSTVHPQTTSTGESMDLVDTVMHLIGSSLWSRLADVTMRLCIAKRQAKFFAPAIFGVLGRGGTGNLVGCNLHKTEPELVLS